MNILDPSILNGQSSLLPLLGLIIGLFLLLVVALFLFGTLVSIHRSWQKEAEKKRKKQKREIWWQSVIETYRALLQKIPAVEPRTTKVLTALAAYAEHDPNHPSNVHIGALVNIWTEDTEPGRSVETESLVEKLASENKAIKTIRGSGSIKGEWVSVSMTPEGRAYLVKIGVL